MTTISSIDQGFNSLFSLQPLVLVLKKMIAEDQAGAKRLYSGLLKEIEEKPELLKPMKNIDTLKNENELVETLLSTIFPPSTTSNLGLYAISFPFRSETIYSSPGFSSIFLNGANIELEDRKTIIDITRSSLLLAYNVILKKLYKMDVSVSSSSVHPFKDHQTGLTKYYSLKLNAQFIDVKLIDSAFSLPENFIHTRIPEIEELKKMLPINNFRFEGLMVIDANDVTQEQVINEIKNSLLKINEFSDNAVYDELQNHVRTLVGLKDVKVGITPFFKVNDYYLYTEAHFKNSLLFRNGEVISNKDLISEECQKIFKNIKEPILYESLKDIDEKTNPLLKYYIDEGIKSLILCPLISDDGNLIGILEIAVKNESKLLVANLSRLLPAIQLFTLALEKGSENLELQVNKTIKDHFTAIQSAVEWKFTEAAFNYLQYRQVSDLAKMPNISFENVYPLYSAIDIRNSSVERSNAIQMDLLEQLEMVGDVLDKSCKISQFPLLRETKYRVDKYISSVSESLMSDDEMIIYEFLQNDIEDLFKNLIYSHSELKNIINDYFEALDPQRKIIYHHRKDYEESITRINDVLDRFIDHEQVDAQDIYPHYFERYVTDGIEFSIYIGQSLSPHHPFNEIYVRNLKLWQLTLLAKAARITNELEKKLSIPLKTTQLILAHSIPLSISFRRKERKFDVDGAYNIRYEIVKKRIDKVHLKESDERLTQPGTIGIVYSQHKELQEYLEFIEFLQSEKLLGDKIEHLELEDTQGISGLKALRVDINLNAEHKVEVSNMKTLVKFENMKN